MRSVKPLTVDVAILGAGTAGLGARRAAKALGKSILMIDPGPFGTTCARVGCMPSKLLIAAADAAHHAGQAAVFGVHPGKVQVDGRAVMKRVQRERDRFVGFVEEVTDAARDEDELLVGRAQVVGPGQLMVNGEVEVRYQSLVIATGSSPFVPPPFRGLEDRFLTNEDIFEMEDLPESLLVIGLGVIGLELGQAFHRLGVRTTLLGVRGALGPLSDPGVLAEARRVLSSELDLHPDYQLKSIERHGDGVAIEFVDSAGAVRNETFSRILMAAGRRPNLDLGLENLDAKPDERGRYSIDPDTLQLGELPVFIAGDVNNLHPLLHEAADDGRIAGRNAATFPDVVAPSRRTPLAIMFSDPQVAIVGKGYRDLEDCHAVAGQVDYGDQGRARVHAIHQGIARIYAERDSGVLIGAELFGPRAEHLAHLLAWAVEQRMTVERALSMPFYHPVVEEGLRTALRDLAANLRRDVPIKCAVTELGVGA